MSAHSKSISFVNLGCSRSVLDCQRIINKLLSVGYDINDEKNIVTIVYCCGEIDAYQEELNDIYNTSHKEGRIIVTGNNIFLPQQKTKNLDKFIYLVQNKENQLIQLIRNFLPIDDDISCSDDNEAGDIITLTPPHFAYLPLSYPAFHKCALVNKLPQFDISCSAYSNDELFDYAKKIATNGAQELLLVAPHTKSVDEVKQLCQKLISLNIWIRLNDNFSLDALDEIVPMMINGDILPTIIINVNECDELSYTLEKIKQWRKIIPNLEINARISLNNHKVEPEIFSAFLDKLSAISFYEIDIFAIGESEEANFNEKAAKINERQKQFKQRHIDDRLGGIEPVMIDDIFEEDENIALGRSIYDAPGYGGIIQIEDIYGAEPGQIVHVELIESVDNNFIAIPA